VGSEKRRNQEQNKVLKHKADCAPASNLWPPIMLPSDANLLSAKSKLTSTSSEGVKAAVEGA
jgi:hypothetical protein